MSDNPLILVDGSGYLHRAFHALPYLSNGQGTPTGAIFGFTNMLKSLLADYRPTHAAVTFDAKGKTFRHDWYPSYKANRPPLPDELNVQIPFIHDITRALGFPILIVDGVEADDVIGTLAQHAQSSGMSVLIFTADKDFAQLVNPQVTLIDTMKNQRLDVQGVQDKFGVLPSQIVDYLTLTGDKVDNVPGVDKVGEKTAAKWLQTYGSLEAVVANAAQITGKVGENLRAALPHLPLSKQLLTVRCDVELPTTPSQLIVSPMDTQTLRSLYTQLAFKQWLNDLPAAETDSKQAVMFTAPVLSNTAPPPVQYQAILTQSDFDHWLKRLNDADLFAIDTETTSLAYLEAQIVGISFAVSPNEAAYIPLAHDYLGAPLQLDRKTVLQALKPVLENPAKHKVGQNLKYDAHVLANHGIQLQGITFDTMLESYVLDSTASRHDLDTLVLQHLHQQSTPFESIAGKGKKQLPFNQIDLQQATPYACEDADFALRLHPVLWTKLQAAQLDKVFTEIEMPLIPVLLRMERTGVKLDAAQLHAQSQALGQRLQCLEQEIYTLAGCEFNLNSPKQLQTLLFDKMHLPIIKKTPKGDASTDVEVLEELAAQYPLPSKILDYRSMSKLKSTYTDGLIEQINAMTGRVHTTYQQAVAVTGRLSSQNPNLQNIPIRTPEGRRIRQAFIAEKGYRLLAADYSQIELRIMAHLSQDEKLLSAFNQAEDIHRATAAEVFSVPLEAVNREQRRQAKVVNFGLIYGMQAFGLAKQLNVDHHEAQRYIETYFERYPGVKAFMDSTRERARTQGFVETVFGRRLYLPEFLSSKHPAQTRNRQYAERAAINAPMQGTAADIIKLAMIKIDHWIQANQLDIKLVMQVHDELVFEVANNQLDLATQQIPSLMSEVVQLAVPLLVEIGVGDNWDGAH